MANERKPSVAEEMEERAVQETVDMMSVPNLMADLSDHVPAAGTTPATDAVGTVASQKPGCSPALLTILVILIIAASVLGFAAIGDTKDIEAVGNQACNAQGARSDGLVLIAAQECEDTEEPTTTATTEVPAAGTPATVDVPADAQLFEGTSGGQIGCITCDGQSRFIHIGNSTTAAGNPARAGQEIVWPENGQIVDFAVSVSGPNHGRYGFNLFTNGEYGNGCSMEIGQTSCRMNAAPLPLRAGDRVTIIVGEGGITNEDGTPASVGDFVATWQFVFQPD